MATLLSYWGVEARDEKENYIKNELDRIRKQFKKNRKMVNVAR